MSVPAWRDNETDQSSEFVGDVVFTVYRCDSDWIGFGPIGQNKFPAELTLQEAKKAIVEWTIAKEEAFLAYLKAIKDAICVEVLQ